MQQCKGTGNQEIHAPTHTLHTHMHRHRQGDFTEVGFGESCVRKQWRMENGGAPMTSEGGGVE